MKKKQLAIIICLILLLQSLALAAGELPDRTQIPTKYKWNLTDIYKDSAVWEKDCQSVQSMEKDYAQYQGKLGASADALYACLQLNDRIGEKLNKVYQYAKLKSDEDIADNNSIEMTGRATQLDSEVSSASSFITPEVSTIDSATIIILTVSPVKNHISWIKRAKSLWPICPKRLAHPLMYTTC